MFTLAKADPQPLPWVPHDHAAKDYRRATDRPAEHGPAALSLFARAFIVVSAAGSLALVVIMVIAVLGGFR